MEPLIQDLKSQIESIQSFCNHRLTDTLEENHSLLRKSIQNCQQAQQLLQEDVTSRLTNSTINTINNALSLYTQALLDHTYYNECKLVDQEFLVDNAENTVQSIIDELDKPFKFQKALSSLYSKEDNILSLDILECLLWRCGALLYMFCHAIKNTKGSLNLPSSKILQILETGITYLIRMLNLRKLSESEGEEFICNDDTTAELIKQGIYSDTHVLAHVYAGEMCYWHWYYSKDSAKGSNTAESLSCDSDQNSILSKFDSCSIGLTLLDQYLKIVNGPLKHCGWDTKKIKILCNILQSQN